MLTVSNCLGVVVTSWATRDQVNVRKENDWESIVVLCQSKIA